MHVCMNVCIYIYIYVRVHVSLRYIMVCYTDIILHYVILYSITEPSVTIYPNKLSAGQPLGIKIAQKPYIVWSLGPKALIYESLDS